MKTWLGAIGALFRSETVRDTDRDWSLIGESEPYYGVLTDPRFKRDALDDSALEEFFASGRDDIAYRLERTRALFGPFDPRSALDFGCGVGRLTRPLAELTGDAVGIDISPGMLAEARKWTGQGASFAEAIPARTFDWVVSLIVLQHIAPERGYGIVDQLVRAVAPGGAIALQITYGRTPAHERSAGARLVIDDHTVRPAIGAGHDGRVRKGRMIMYDYDLSRIIGTFHRCGLSAIHLEHTDHGGLIGVTLYARKSA